MDLSVSLGRLKLKNPVLTASGTFGYGIEFQDFGDLKKLGGIVVKGLSLNPKPGNPPPRICETPCGMLNSIGLQNIGIKRFIKEILPLLPWNETAVIVNIFSDNLEEFEKLAEIAAERKEIAAIEVNISCPNVKKGGVLFGQDPKIAEEVTKRVKLKAKDKPVIVKLTPNVQDIKIIAKAVENGGADIISLINTVFGMAVDIYTRRPKLSNVFGGLSGPAIKPIALKLVYEVCQTVNIPVIGVGGITSAEDVLEFILVGAFAVQIGSANFIDPYISFKIVEELPKLVKKLKIKKWEDFRGSLLVK